MVASPDRELSVVSLDVPGVGCITKPLVVFDERVVTGLGPPKAQTHEQSAGQRLASEAGPAGGVRTRRPWVPSLPFVAHRLGVSELYVSLTEAARASACEVLGFEAEPQSWRRFTGPHGAAAYVKPDAAVRLAVGEFERGAFVEIDRATEARPTLTRKCTTYRRYWEAGREQARFGYFPRVVFAVPTEARKAAVADVFAAQPEEAWELFRVVLARDLTGALLGAEVAR